MSARKVVRVTYCVDEMFCVPDNINLEDTTQVEGWWVKYNTLHIILVGGKEIEIQSQGWFNQFDTKYPSAAPEIEDAADFCLAEDDDAFKPVDLDSKDEESEK
ncbi:MAG: hypothetical protein EBU90_21995 [Proteobacteria bacterium]|nr:hypothetical protein [Pseudomonadota bacterium]NBP15995.1 hypothetical protein [bacterium]